MLNGIRVGASKNWDRDCNFFLSCDLVCCDFKWNFSFIGFRLCENALQVYGFADCNVFKWLIR